MLPFRGKFDFLSDPLNTFAPAQYQSHLRFQYLDSSSSGIHFAAIATFFLTIAIGLATSLLFRKQLLIMEAQNKLSGRLLAIEESKGNQENQIAGWVVSTLSNQSSSKTAVPLNVIAYFRNESRLPVYGVYARIIYKQIFQGAESILPIKLNFAILPPLLTRESPIRGSDKDAGFPELLREIREITDRSEKQFRLESLFSVEFVFKDALGKFWYRNELTGLKSISENIYLEFSDLPSVQTITGVTARGFSSTSSSISGDPQGQFS